MPAEQLTDVAAGRVGLGCEGRRRVEGPISTGAANGTRSKRRDPHPATLRHSVTAWERPARGHERPDSDGRKVCR